MSGAIHWFRVGIYSLTVTPQVSGTSLVASIEKSSAEAERCSSTGGIEAATCGGTGGGDARSAIVETGSSCRSRGGTILSDAMVFTAAGGLSGNAWLRNNSGDRDRLGDDGGADDWVGNDGSGDYGVIALAGRDDSGNRFTVSGDRTPTSSDNACDGLTVSGDGARNRLTMCGNSRSASSGCLEVSGSGGSSGCRWCSSTFDGGGFIDVVIAYEEVLDRTEVYSPSLSNYNSAVTSSVASISRVDDRQECRRNIV